MEKLRPLIHSRVPSSTLAPNPVPDHERSVSSRVFTWSRPPPCPPNPVPAARLSPSRG